MKEFIVVSNAPKMDFRNDYVALPSNYGSDAYYHRADVQAIQKLVFDNLNTLNKKNGFTSLLSSYETILIKPNLVSVYHNSGLQNTDYPESTDPRVFDAILTYLEQFHKNIVIVESSGKPMPTKTSFKVAGYDRIARHHHMKLIALENCAVTRYMLPKAEIMKEVYIPELFQDVIDGKAYYISVPKLKTNLYTQVTLGFKNAMGTIPYALRERNHNYCINKKLADLLYLFKPNLIIIDGLIGGEGNTPAPVDPVDSHVIISGTNSVEVDKVGTRIMGLNPDQIPLIQEAVKRGFGTSETEIIGTLPQFSFRRANPSLMDDSFHQCFPNVLVLAGHNLPHAPVIENPDHVSPAQARQLEMACDGGCLAALRSGFDYVIYSPQKNYKLPLTVIVGGGIVINGIRYWFDRNGCPYTEEQIRRLEAPLLTLGNCASILDDIAKHKASGCCSPSACMLAATAAMKIPFPLLSTKNKALMHLGTHVLSMVLHRSWLILRGKWVDCPSEHKNKIYPIPELEDAYMNADYLPWPLPKMGVKLRWKLIQDQFAIMKL